MLKEMCNRLAGVESKLFVLVGELLLIHDNASLIVLERNTFLLSLSVVHFPLFEMAVKL
jgi:hypothetical protein